ncbi:glycosyltransferase family 2 protein [Pontibacter ruber]|uniref:Glycosyltransferase family 2 protein n=1 Tax=Pontibacter ruber TaxID=1343895 RepID=A0ABW5D034_9BACT|nr:glycosyltransferase [Pontibacter ruber]
MKEYSPYHIIHVYLDQQLTQPQLATQQGNYLVFWWQDVALGQLFIEPATEINYSEELLKAIAPAINYYTQLQEKEATNWYHWIINHQFEEWSSWMRELLLPYSHAVLPEIVPVTAIVCSRNRPIQLQNCLNMLSQLRCKPSEIIVVDNASDDENSIVNTVNQFLEAKYVREPRIGLDIARNTGIQKASFPIVAFVDDDVQAHSLWIYYVWETLQNPAVAAMTGLVITSELATRAQYLFEKYWSFNRGYVDKVYDRIFFSATLTQGPPVWRIGAGANMAFRKDIFNEVGYFNEMLDVGAAGCNGDSEMWYRILAHGQTITYNPRAIVFHEHRKELAGLKKQIFYYMRGHTAAALTQQKQHQQAGYKRYLLKLFLKAYTRSIVKGFPDYQAKYSTLWAQISGAASGLAYYFRNKGKLNNAISK